MDHSPGGIDIILEDFGQRVDLTRRIREILVNYPEGTTVLKELIQNADDAGATKAFFCLDRRFHGVDSLLSSKLSQFQGPALLAFNDAVFTEDDFVSISRIGDSAKHSDAWKTGRFGVGFNSVYHLTDLPSFVSNKYVVLLDPHGSYLPNVSAENPGKRLDFISSSAMPLYEDQFRPYCAFGCDMKNPFPGTLFRFPLRNADQAATSKLSKQAYTADDISFMFSELFEEAVFCLLFLKSIISIEMYVWDTGVDEPHKIYSCAVRESKEKIAQNRRTLLRLYSSTEVLDLHLDSFLVNFICEAVTGGHSDRRVDSFFLVQGMASASSRIGSFAAMAAKEYDLHLLPWASVAICLSNNLPEDHALKQGRAFCSLPLPVRTGFNVHVNGYFEVYPNRRSMWFGYDLDRVGKLRSDWNRLLFENVVAPAYCELLVGLSKLLGPSKLYYSAWPTGLFEEPWSILAENIYRVAYSAKVLYSNLEGGIWISPSEAFFNDAEFSKNELLGEALVLLGMPVVCLPGIIFNTMYKYWSNFRISLVSPIILRSFLKESGKLGTLKKSYKLVLLQYCLTDLSTEDVSKHLEGLVLLPLANGEFGTFTKTMSGTNYFICSDLEYSVLELSPDIMIDRAIPSDLFSLLSEIARISQTNLVFLNEKYFLQLFPRFFPSEWRYKNRMLWNPGVGSSHPTATWFTYFWDYIQSQSYDISTFGEWPILPSTSGHLYRTSKTSKFINAEKLSGTLRELLAKLGCKILDPAYKIKHCDLSLYISDSNASCILNSIFDIVTSGGNEIWLLFEVLSDLEKIELRRFLLDPQWYHGSFLSEIHIRNAKKLPIYGVYGEHHVKNIHFHNLESPKRYLPPLDISQCFLDGDFVFCSSITEEEILLRYFGIERMPKSTFYRKYVLTRLDELQPDFRDKIMLSILKELPQLCLDDSSLKESLRGLKFIPTVSGSLDCPESLYDPRVDELYALLNESNCFPSGLFGEHSVLDMLLCLGLRTSVSADTIIKSAHLVESIMREDQLKAYLHGKVLLSYLEVHANKWFYNNDRGKGVNMMFSRVSTSRNNGNFSSQDGIEKFWNDLRMICWCPVLDSAPNAGLPWPVVSSLVAPPKIVRPREDIWLVSASSRILDGECRSLPLFSNLGWSSPPSGTVIAAQLLEYGKNNEIVVDQVLRQELVITIPKIYSLLTNLIGSDEMDIVKVILEGCRWIWVGDGFSTVSEVVLNGHFHLSPYMRVIPVDLAVFRNLFLELGVPEYLKPVDCANILYRMAEKKGCTPLDAQELRAAVSMAQHLAEIQFQHLYVKIYLPDFLSRLMPATDLVYNDAPWLLDLGGITCGDGSSVHLKPRNNIYNFVHGNISNDIAEKLGVSSLRRLLLAESSDSMNLSLSGVSEAFGQHEALTTRLKHIVEMYADGPGILFELVQNAEDALASEVVFLLDKTQYGTSSILSPQMAEWQGPALYCFNDSVFSSQDLYAISRIGQDSKFDKPFAIGRFGLGFNSVYHFTDIPGFVSGENIVIFDPHASHLPGISPTHPGLRIKFVGRRILEQFPDQFMPFLHFGCDLQQPFSGTLFRFPLRNETAAHRSEIKKEKYSPEDVELLFSTFTEVVSESLLFLHNIQRVTIFIKDGSALEMRLLHRVSRHSGSGLGKELQPHHNMLSFVHGIQQNGMDRDQFMTKLDKIAESDLPWNCQKIVLLEQSPYGSNLHVWVVSECLGGGRAKSKFLSVSNQSIKFIPWGSVACYLHSANLQDLNDDDLLDTKVESYACLVALGQTSAAHYRKNFMGRAFCFLPLPICTGLPIHVNAYFELSSNRRDIWFGDDMAGGGKVRSQWNLCLLEDVITPAYGRLLIFITQEVGPCDLYFSFWPTSSGLETWKLMARKFYLFLSDQRLPVLYTKARGGRWISARQAIFPDFTFPNAIELAEVLSEAGLPVANVSSEIVKRFMDSCPSLHFLTPELLRSILIRHTYGFKNKVALVTALDYCLSDLKVISSCGSLNGLPLLPLANGKVTSFNKRGDGDRVFVTSTEVFDLLVESVPYLLVDCSIPDITLKKLRDIANSGLTNLHVLTCYCLVELLPRILPTEWQHARQVRWTPGHQGQPSLEWMRLFWSYLKASCNDLSIFNTWPILPVNNGLLLQLVENSAVIRDDGWSENMSSLLQKLGFSFLRSDLPLDHLHLRNFVHEATATGILNALQASCPLQDIKNLFLNASKVEMRELRGFIFQSRWFSGDQIGSMQIEIIRHLPIFESYKNEGLLTLINPLKWLKPVDVLEDLVDDNFIKTESDREKSILQNYLGFKELPKADFYKNFVFDRIEGFLEQPNILLTILVDAKQLFEEDDSVKSALSEMPFVLAANGSWQQPSRLYDPRVPSLQNLLNKEVFFPCDKFSNSKILDILTSFGLRNSLNLSGLIDVARSVSMLHDCGHVDASQYGKKLLSYLNALGILLSNSNGQNNNEVDRQMLTDGISHTKDLVMKIDEKESCDCNQDVLSFLSSFVLDKQECEFWSEIKIIPWCPVYVSPPLIGLPWFASDRRIATPDTTRPKSQMWQVSSKMRILDGDCYSTYVLDKLGWMDPPDIETLSTQLVALSKSYAQLKLQSEHEFHIDDVLQREMPPLYSKLQDYIDKDDFNVLREALDGINWVWVGDSFVQSKSVAFDSPVKYHPYLYAVPSELSEFRSLLLRLGVRLTFDSMDYLHVLQCLEQDAKGEPLIVEQVSFVQCVLEAFADSLADRQSMDALLNSLFIPSSSGILMNPSNLVYNDAPWIDINSTQKHFVHSGISNDLAKRLGVQSLQCLSLVDEETARDFSCMDYTRISDLLALYGESDFLSFDLLEIADCLQAKKLHLIYDKRQHPKQSLLQHNLGKFQGSALTVVLEGATMSVEEVHSLQLPPPWKIRGNNLNYGLGFVGSYFICDIMTMVTGGCFFIFDPLGLVLTASSSGGPSAKLYSLIENDVAERFPDQFSPLLLNQRFCSLPNDSTFIRMPLSSKGLGDGFGCEAVTKIFNRFINHASSALLSLKSLFQVTLSTWEEGNLQPSLDYSVSIDPSVSITRNPFPKKRWKKFQLSRIFSTSPDAIKMHVLDVHITQGDRSFVDKWLVVLCLGSGKTRNMALDRRYLPHNLTPFAGVAAHISQNGQPVRAPTSSCILSPLPLSGVISMPVTIIGCFLTCHIGGRYLFSHSHEHDLREQTNANDHLAEAWNKELLLCIRDSYVQLVLEFQKIRKDFRTSFIESNSAHSLSYILQAYGDRIYSFWPNSKRISKLYDDVDSATEETFTAKASEVNWASLVEQVIRPFYFRLVDMPVWQLYSGNVVKANEGMFLSQFGGENVDNLPSARVCSFLKERYPIFSMPSDLVKEIQALGIKVREITPKMIRGLLKSSVAVLPESVEMYIDVLDYCLSDIQIPDMSARELSSFNNRLNSVDPLQLVSDNLSVSSAPFLSSKNLQGIHRDAFQSSSSSGGDAFEVVTQFGKALYDFGRGVVEDIGKAAGPLPNVDASSGMCIYSDGSLASILEELKGLPLPTSKKCLLRLGMAEILIGNKEQQLLMHPLADQFVHTLCLEKSFLAKILFTQSIQKALKLRSFTPQLLSDHLRLLLTESWVTQVLSVNQAPWVPWDNTATAVSFGPHPEWIRLFWKIFRDIKGDLSLISDWPLIPAVLNRPILCRVKESKLIFIPAILDPSPVTFDGIGMINSSGSIGKELNKLYSTGFEMISSTYPWLISLLYHLSIPVYDMSFLDCASSFFFFPTPGQSLGHAIVSKLLAAKYAGSFSVPLHLSDEDRDRLFTLFASDHKSPSCCLYKREELDILKELPIYKTVTGSYTMIIDRKQCTISPTAFFHPKDEQCLSHSSDTNQFLHALGVDELTDQEIFVRFGLPDFEMKTSAEKEDILLYLYLNWKYLQLDTTLVNTLKETNFVRTANEVCTNLFKPRDLLDPHDSLLSSVFSGERSKFPGERFMADGWLRILRKTGLRTSSEGDMIIECARKIELLGREAMAHGDLESFESELSFRKTEVSMEIWSLAESVVVTIFANLSSLFSNDFCDMISNIAFVPAEKGLPIIGGKKGGNRVLCSYREAILPKDWPLAWSTAPILVKLNVVPPDFSWGPFHLRSPPPFYTVLNHLLVIGRNNGEDTLARWPRSPGMMTVEDASLEILKYLDTNWGAISSSNIRKLQKIPFIPVANGTRFVTVASLFVRLTINLSPFAFELPIIYLPFVKILKEIGVHEVLTVDHAKDLILNIQKSCGYQRLNPNEFRAVMVILNFICNNSIKSSSDGSEYAFDHIVPDDGCRLVSANSCVYVDLYGSQFLAEIDTSRIRFCHSELTENMCMTLGIKKVSDVIIEELDEPQLQVVDQICSVPLNKIKNKLLSKHFQHALWKIIDGMKDHSPSFEGMNFEHLERSVSQVAYTLQFVRLLHTRFLLLSNNVDITRIPKGFAIPEWEWSHRHRTIHFVDDSRKTILVAEPPSYISIYDVIAIVVSKILEAPSILPIGSILACPDGSEEAVLITVKIGSEIGFTREDKNNIIAGKELVPQDALQVQLLPMRPFYRGEIVAWKPDKGQKLRYGVVSEDVRPTSGQAIHKIPLEISPGVLQAFLSTQVFSFKSVSMVNVTKMPSLPENSQVTSENVFLNAQENKETGKGKEEQQAARELRFGKVSAEETVQAVHDMLLTAGISMDSEQQTLLRTTLTLQEQIKEFQVALLAEQEKAETASRDADTAKTAWSCRVCLSSEVDTAIVPCGHVLCYKCCSEVHRCPFCRCLISNKQKIFRP